MKGPLRRARAADLVIVRATLALATLLVSLCPTPARADGVGVMIDAGLPDGATWSLATWPVRWVRLHAGGGTNLISPGLRAGVSLCAIPALTLNVDGGHYFPGDANATLELLGITDQSDVPLLRRVGYDYVNFHAGLELGGEMVKFYLHAGVSHIRTTVSGIEETVNDSDFDGSITTSSDPRLRIWTVSARIGLVFTVFP